MNTLGTPQPPLAQRRSDWEDDNGTVSPAENAAGRQRMLARGFDAQTVALLFGTDEPQQGGGLDLGALEKNLGGKQGLDNPEGKGSIAQPGGGLDLGAIEKNLAASGGQPKSLLAQFNDELATPEAEMYGRHTTYAGRVKDIPRDIQHERQAGLDTMKSVGQRGEGEGRAMGLLHDFGRIVGGGAQLVFAPATGTVKSLAGRPLAEHYDVTFRTGEPTAKEEFEKRSFGERVRGATPKASVTKHEEGTPADPEGVEKLTGALTFVVPGIGLIRYRDLGARIANTEVSRAVQRILSPTTLSDDSRAASELLRGAGGQAARETETTRAVLSAHQQAMNALPPAQQLNFIHAVEGGPAAITTLPQPQRDLANSMRMAFDQRRQALANLPSTAGADFIDDYFPHMWQDPARARAVFGGGGGPSRQGSGASLRARTIPTIADGLAAGLEPVSTNPIEVTMRYIASMDRFIAAERAREASVQAGYATWIRPRVVGASGHPAGFAVPEGWSPLGGRGSSRFDGSRLYAPDDFARVYNNFISRGVEGDWGQLYNAALRSSNFVTAFELTLSGYHALAMTHEAAVSQMASAIQNIVGGARQGSWQQVLRGTGQMATHPLAFASRFRTGRQVERVYLGMTPGTPDMARIVGLLERAGGRGVGARHAQIQASAGQNYWQALRAGSLRAMHAADLADIRASPVLGTARTFFRTMGRAMDTIGHPLFNTYIPRLKNGAFYETMRTWLDNHPNATHAEQVRAARMVWDSIDNRFGELVQDNIFWHNTLKRAAQLGMRSYSWNMGTIREIGGGVMDTAAGRGQGQAAAHVPSTVLDSTRAAYIVALPVVAGTMNAIYQYLKTGKGPESVDDLVAARTGGDVPGPAVPSNKPFGRSQRNEIPERVMLPGYQKDVFGWYDDWQKELQNKVATLPRTVVQLMQNRDWRDLPIVNPEDSAPEWLKQYFKFALDSYGPITLRQKDKPDSKISGGERMMGLREAPSYLTAPEDYAEQQKRLGEQKWRQKQNIEKRQQQLYGGTDEE
jgi:hypothetical protein